MKNLRSYGEDTFDFYSKAIKAKYITKNDPTYKDRLAVINDAIKKKYLDFDSHFKKNTLEELVGFGYKEATKEDLLSLYSFKSKIIQELKVTVTTTETNRIISTCQNCTIGEVNSFDHVMPKDEFVEFAVNPKNLFPSCTKCNGYKSITWLRKGKRLFLNLYLDDLPKVQYLFVNLNIDNRDVDAEFYLYNHNRIDADLFALIENHYKNLYLCQRFSENIDSVVPNLINSIETYIEKLTLEEIKESAIDIALKNKAIYGYNYWKSILEIALLNNDDFMDRFKSTKTVRSS